jgi:hypothetical protein
MSSQSLYAPPSVATGAFVSQQPTLQLPFIQNVARLTAALTAAKLLQTPNRTTSQDLELQPLSHPPRPSPVRFRLFKVTLMDRMHFTSTYSRQPTRMCRVTE